LRQSFALPSCNSLCFLARASPTTHGQASPGNKNTHLTHPETEQKQSAALLQGVLGEKFVELESLPDSWDRFF
jgi:hypothetical protein